MSDFTHFNEQGRAKMVNVGEKDSTHRTAKASCKILINRETFNKVKDGGMKKGDVLAVAQVAGIMGAKKTPDLIPMCHPILLNGIDLSLSLNEEDLSVDILSELECNGNTGVEMEALTACTIAALTVYDMCKAVQKDIVITSIRLEKKTGGIHGDYNKAELDID
ncbi:cyclic pyranopterin monophosphate synthase MoaC [Pleomorphochaeta sp. DL1XJH-081]|uniref:cyclic pyranopterin monophosphate synthase MoaC n=1 Tax=Pleomorphochaeta sp. DL1XJH-081 TaxID=3409690 RepID=UPI003BB66DD4